MPKSFGGFPRSVISETTEGMNALGVETGFTNNSKPTLIIGNVLNQVLLAPSTGRKIILKGISILGNGNTGTVKVTRESNGEIILPGYFSAQGKPSTSPAFNFRLDTDEKVLVTCVDRQATDETFIGLSYIEVY
jgi:hypothetical protein